jgi:hypothetical protein
MVALTPPLMWVPNVSDSLSRALGCLVSYDVRPTVNPLLYTIAFHFSTPQEPKYLVQIWNLVQMYAARNDSLTSTVEMSPLELRASIGVKRRLGPPRTSTP